MVLAQKMLLFLLSNFDVDGSGDNPVLEPNSTYTDIEKR